jgi:prepilin-type N-terminal cleavage/methylation domain-containing protein
MSKSFTLIEILVVIVVIGVLSAFILVGMSSITSSANIAKSQAFLNSMDNSLLLARVSQWKLDEGSGATVNDSWGANTGTLGSSPNNPTWINSGCSSDDCLSFDGSNDYVNCGSGTNLNMGTGDFTISAWVKPTTNIDEYSTIVERGYGNNGFDFVYRSSTTQIYLYIHTTGYGFGYTPTIGQWNHMTVAADRDGYASFYLNGIWKQNTNISAQSSVNMGTDTLYIGGLDGTVDSFTGLIDDIRIYNQALSSSEINQNYYIGINKLFKNQGIALNEFNQRITELKTNLVAVNKNTPN